MHENRKTEKKCKEMRNWWQLQKQIAGEIEMKATRK